MDMDNSYIEPLLDDWLEGLQTAVKAQENLINNKNEFYMPFVAIPDTIVTAIFKISEYLDLEPDAKYIAIDLYDKFMCNYFWEIYKNTEHTQHCWSQVCKTISSQSKLYLMSCVQLATKMNSHFKNLTISQVLNTLQQIDKRSEYTPNLISMSEYRVFKTIGFKMPFYTPLNSIEVLLAATGLGNNPNMKHLTITLLDLVYLEREKVYSHFQRLMQEDVIKPEEEKRTLMILKSNVLFLGASIVLCGALLSCIDGETAKVIASRLAKFINVKMNNIWDMANILFVLAIQEQI